MKFGNYKNMKLLSIIFILVFSLSVVGQTTAPLQVEYVYWDADKTKCPICDYLTRDGSHQYIFNAPDVGILFSSSYTDKIIYSTVYILNKSDTRIEFNPATEAMLFQYKSPTEKTPVIILPMSPTDAAKKIKGSQGVKNFFTALSAAMQKQAITVNSTTNGTATATSSSGGMASGIYTEQTTSTVMIPDTDAQAKAQETIAERNRLAEERKNDVLNSALRENTIFPQKNVSGNVYFPLIKGGMFYFGIKIGNKVYLKRFNGLK